MLDFTPPAITPTPDGVTISTGQEIPKEMDVYFKAESEFLPPGKTFSDLTPEETRVLQTQYRFSPGRPGIYQGITFISNANAGNLP